MQNQKAAVSSGSSHRSQSASSGSASSIGGSIDLHADLQHRANLLKIGASSRRHGPQESAAGEKINEWTVPLDLVANFQEAREALENREQRAREELGRKRRDQEQFVGELLWTLDERDRLKRKADSKLYKAWAAADEQGYLSAQLHREIARLRRSTDYLEQEQDELASSNRLLRKLVDDLEVAAPKVVLKRRAPPIRLAWRLENVEELRKFYPRTTCVFSPSILDPRLKARPGELDFYPNGDAKAPSKHCTVALRLPRGTKATFQLFVGESRTETVKVVFSDAVREYARHFDSLSQELRITGDDTLVVGAEILWSQRTKKHLL
eukprot:gnl/MRDRNA2_/MRDRNA2_48795_c0_seq1.p1 gnl/MRDRNA2_/MRDRNA2_48795_c0~~gnl/MRDRNA2_/MRDRNA2_48795_c0_seq1.p1  ORF type:complete len:323 (-),score=77.00 gnl/MRDRNA2_/MRDRNA2_48795_c0_seq1:228-1196(-)